MSDDPHTKAVRDALVAAGWLVRPAPPGDAMLRVWNARLDDDQQLVVEFSDHSYRTLTLHEPGALTKGA